MCRGHETEARTTLRTKQRRNPGRRSAASRPLRHEYQRAGIPAARNIIEEHLAPLASAIEQLTAEVDRQERG
jgi:hypothetical protein